MALVISKNYQIWPKWFDDSRVKCKWVTKFFYPSQPSSDVAMAKAVCNGLDGRPICYFRDRCLQHAIDRHESYGVWGGTSERDRRKIQRARNRFKNKHIYSLEDVKFPQVQRVPIQTIVFIHPRGADNWETSA